MLKKPIHLKLERGKKSTSELSTEWNTQRDTHSNHTDTSGAYATKIWLGTPFVGLEAALHSHTQPALAEPGKWLVLAFRVYVQSPLWSSPTTASSCGFACSSLHLCSQGHRLEQPVSIQCLSGLHERILHHLESILQISERSGRSKDERRKSKMQE